MTDQLARARADLETGRAWKARDRLHGLLIHRQDFDVLDLLATVHYTMQDLPAAGALWFVTGRDDETARECIAAWRERYGSDRERWRSVPGSIRRGTVGGDLRSLREAALHGDRIAKREQRAGQPSEAWWERVVFGGGCLLFVLWIIAMIGIGVWTAARWIWD